jgi:predicted molibdopterin-dependent oxidoreductase YjgC
VKRHRKALLALYLTDHPEGAGKEVGNELMEMAEQHQAPRDWGRMPSLRQGRRRDPNPYIHFTPDSCILCARCVRYCHEVEGVTAIALAGRGSRTTIATADQRPLYDTTCEMCGGCIDVCPTGAMVERASMDRLERSGRSWTPEAELEVVRTTCPYCGVGCQMDLHVDPRGNLGRGEIVRVTSPEPGTTTNDGNLCVKGRFGYGHVHHPHRLETPLVREKDGELRETSWDEALKRAARGLLAVQERHGTHALGFVSSSRCTGEENFLVQKLARGVFGTNNVHQCAAT